MSLGQRMGVFGAAVLIAATALASFIAPYDPGRQFSDRPFAPPTLPHVVDDDGHLRAPFVYPLHLVDPLERRYEADHRQPMTLHWFRGRLVSVDGLDPWFLLGSDGLGRDVLSRLALGARLSLGVAAAATSVALALGILVGATAGSRAGVIDNVLMRLADAVLVLPGIYVILALRGAMPLVLSTRQIFVALVAVLGLVGWPGVARGVRRNLRHRTHAGVRRSGQGPRSQPRPPRAGPPAASGAKFSATSNHGPPSGVHPGGGHDLRSPAWALRRRPPVGGPCCRTPRRPGSRPMRHGC